MALQLGPWLEQGRREVAAWLEPVGMAMVREGSRSEGRESGCRLVPGKGERGGKVPWQPVVLGGSPEVMVMEEGPLGRGELGDASESAQAVECKGEKQWCCFISLHHAHPSRLFLPTERSAWPAGCLQNAAAPAGRKRRQLEQR